jgi:hypothetical protein
MTPADGGRNNRVYQVIGRTTSGILKQYYHDASSGRDRFACEVAWYEFCAKQHVRQMPKLWAADATARCALFEEIPGRRLAVSEISDAHVRQAAQFFLDLNSDRQGAIAANLPEAADASFTIGDYLVGVERRLEKLTAVPLSDRVSEAMHAWVVSSLVPTWAEVRARIESEFSLTGLHALLPLEQRRLSPSDFGFHNALVDEQGVLWFFDFEYAGWDDPAKMVCDFFWQVEVSAPRSSMAVLLDAVGPTGEEVGRRVEALFPLFGVKWCAIVLNDFLSEESRRRSFAAGRPTHDDDRLRQLQIAEGLLTDVRRALRPDRQ